MPELAEVRLMCDFINKIAISIPFTHVELPENTKVKCDLSILPSLFMISAKSRGKELILNISNVNECLSFNMGMSGTWIYINRNNNEIEEKFINHNRLAFVTPTGGKLILVDHRRFAKWKWVKGFSSKRGPDPLDEFFKFSDIILSNYGHKDFNVPVCEIMLNQKYFNGIGNYLRSTILYYSDVNPFQSLNSLLESEKIFTFLELCKDVPSKMYQAGGGEIKDWHNPFGKVVDQNYIQNYIFYNKGLGVKDKTGRTFWFHPKWEDKNIYEIKYRKNL